MSNQVDEVMLAIRETNALGIADPVKESLVRDLQPIADRLICYTVLADEYKCVDEETAKRGAESCKLIAADTKAVKDQEVLSKITDGLHKLHRTWTGIRKQFLDPLETSRKVIKDRVNVWQAEQERIAEAKQAQLQAEADAKARKEQAALAAKAEKVKTPEKKEQYREQAAAVIAPTVVVQAPKSGMKFQTRWKVKTLDVGEFLKAAADNPMLVGYVEIKQPALERSKAANPALELPGVSFHKVRV